MVSIEALYDSRVAGSIAQTQIRLKVIAMRKIFGKCRGSMVVIVSKQGLCGTVGYAPSVRPACRMSNENRRVRSLCASPATLLSQVNNENKPHQKHQWFPD